MPCVHNTTFYQEIQGFSFDRAEFDPFSNKTIYYYTSNIKASEVACPRCGGKAHIKDSYTTFLKDMPYWPGEALFLALRHNRYLCTECGQTFTEKLPVQYPGTRITERAARWIKSLLKSGMSVSGVVRNTLIHWDVIRKVHLNYMQDCLRKRDEEWKATGYKPEYLAVDEFAIHKRHKYATCVIDLVKGDIIWVGKGRSMEDFSHFFEEIDKDFLSEVKAVAMDMNASYNRLFEEHLPASCIVYDRYHIQADYGRSVLGVVRLREAREHKFRAQQLKDMTSHLTDPYQTAVLKKRVKDETSVYSAVKHARWLLLMRSANLKEEQQEALNGILAAHSDISVCYGMKEEMTRLFGLRDTQEAQIGWTAWFGAAKSSEIEELVKFGKNKEKRLPGLIAHAAHPISTGRLEGINNKIKVAKRIGYGYRDDNYFFTLIKYLSLSSPEKS